MEWLDSLVQGSLASVKEAAHRRRVRFSEAQSGVLGGSWTKSLASMARPLELMWWKLTISLGVNTGDSSVVEWLYQISLNRINIAECGNCDFQKRKVDD